VVRWILDFSEFDNFALMRYRIIAVVALVFYSTGSLSQRIVLTKDDTIRGSVTPERVWWDLQYYELNVTVLPDEKALRGHVTVVYQVLDPKNVMQIDLQPPLKIDSVLQDNRPLAFRRYGRNAYLIDLNKQQPERSKQSIIIWYSGKPLEAKNPPWQGGVQWATDSAGNPFIATSCQGLGASAWWPCKDHLYDEPDSMRIVVTVPEDLMNVSNGRLITVVENKDNTKTYEWFVKNPISNYTVNINIAKYAHFMDTLRGENGILDLDYYVLPANLEKAKEQFKQAKLMMKAFEHWFGPYPFYSDGYKLVEVPYLGMEHQSSVTYGNGFKNGYRGRDLSNTGWGLKWDFIIIHESGHEWFANNITYKDIADMWIHEGFTNYSESLYIDYYFGSEAATDYVVGTRKHITNERPIIGTYNVNKSGSGDMYSKGGNMLHTIRHSLNDDMAFREILRGLNASFYHQTVTSQQIEKFISEESGRDFSKVFDQYLRGIQIPVLEYYFKGNRLFFRWTNCVEGFDLSMPVSLKQDAFRLSPTDKWKSKRLRSGERSQFDPKAIERLYYVSIKEHSTR
jgi:aminopeptidase N